MISTDRTDQLKETFRKTNKVNEIVSVSAEKMTASFWAELNMD